MHNCSLPHFFVKEEAYMIKKLKQVVEGLRVPKRKMHIIKSSIPRFLGETMMAKVSYPFHPSIFSQHQIKLKHVLRCSVSFV